MGIKIKIRRQKKWNELTDKEKLEYLKMEQEDTWFSSWKFILIIMAFFMLVFVLMHVAILKIQVGDLYQQLNISPTANTTAQTDKLIATVAEIGNPFRIAILLLIAIMIIEIAWHTWKWRKFNKSIRRN